jgi:hypothetical protein
MDVNRYDSAMLRGFRQCLMVREAQIAPQPNDGRGIQTLVPVVPA